MLRVALLATVVALVTVPGLAAAETQAQSSVHIESGEQHEGDLTAVAGTVVVDGSVQGNLTAVGADVLVTRGSQVTGDITAVASSVDVRGYVGGDVTAAAGSFKVADTSNVGGEARVNANTVVVEGTISDDVHLTANTLDLEGATFLGNLSVNQGAQSTDGNISSLAGNHSNHADREGSIVATVTPVPGTLTPVFWMVAYLLAGGVFLVGLPGLSGRVLDKAVDDPITSPVAGVAAAVGIPLVLVVLVATIVGAPLALAGLGLLVGLAFAGAVYGRIALGAVVLDVVDVDNRWLSLVVGAVAVGALAIAPYLGTLVEAAVFVYGFGALVLAVYSSLS